MAKIYDDDEQGGYKPNPHRQTILDSLTEIPYQSSRHLCINTGVSVDDVLAIVEGDQEIGCQFTGGMMAYFLKVNEPSGKLYNSGANSFLVKQSEPQAPVAGRRRKSKITPEAVEQCAFEGLTFEQAAEQLGISVANLQYQCYSKTTPVIKAAWQKGKDRRVAAGLPLPDGRKNKSKKQPAAPAVNGTYQTIPVTDAEDEAFREIETENRKQKTENRKQKTENTLTTALEIRPKFKCGDRVQTDFNGAFLNKYFGVVSQINVRVSIAGMRIEYEVVGFDDAKTLHGFRLEEEWLERI